MSRVSVASKDSLVSSTKILENEESVPLKDSGISEDRIEVTKSSENEEDKNNDEPEKLNDPKIIKLKDGESYPPLYKTYKGLVLLFAFPIILLICFYPVDNTKVICPAPCWTVKNPKIDQYIDISVKDCEKAWNYHKNFCEKRCMPCQKDETICILNWMDPQAKKAVGNDLLKKKTAAEEYWQKERDAGCWEESRANEEGVLDGMDYALDGEKKKFDSLYNFKKASCAYCVLLMSCYWISEAIPLPVTALLPPILYPLFSIAASKDLVVKYFSDIIALFFGGLSVAAAIEYTKLHRRLALSALTVFGGDPKFLLLGFMSITAFLAMWISNIATAAMIFPTAIAVLDELKTSLDQEVEMQAKEHQKNNSRKHNLKSVTNHESDGNGSDYEVIRGAVSLEILSNQAADDYAKEVEEKYHAQKMLMKAMCIGIGYCSSIGGMGMFTGTAVNMIFAGLLPDDSGISFGTFAVYNLPICIALVLACWGVLYFCFLKGTRECSGKDLEKIEAMITEKYQALGPITHQEKLVSRIFICLVCLWLTRNPGFLPGWGSIYPFNLKNAKGAKYVTDATVALTMAFVLFCTPKHPIQKWRIPEPLISFKECCKMLPWSVLFLLGGGFAMAKGIQESGLGNWIGTKLFFLEGQSNFNLVLGIVTLCSVTTQFAANTAVATTYLPIILALCIEIKVNPILLMAAGTNAINHAFLLPVSTPPNALAIGYDTFDVPDMMKAGAILAGIGIVITTFATFTLAPLAFPGIFDPCVEWFVRMAENSDLTTFCLNQTATVV